MSSAMTPANCGLNINYQTHDDDEAEFEREELERQNELRALLTNALDADDLLDDDDDDSTRKSISNLSQDLNNTADDRSELSWQLDVAPAVSSQQTSTPCVAQSALPALKTPATVYQQYYQPAEPPHSLDEQYSGQEDANDELDGFRNFVPQPQTWSHDDENTLKQCEYTDQGQYVVSDEEYHLQLQQQNQNMGAEFQRYGADAETDDGQQFSPHHPEMLHFVQHQCSAQWADSGQFAGFDNAGNNFRTDELVPLPQHGYEAVQQHQPLTFDPHVQAVDAFESGPSAFENNLLATWPQSRQSMTAQPVNRQVNNQSPTKACSRNTGLESGDQVYRVKYRQQVKENCHISSSNSGEICTNQQLEMAKELPSTRERLQQEFLCADGANTWSERETQMRVLLDAKGHKIDELTYALNDLRETSSREIRILKHQLLMATDEKDGLAGSLQQSEKLIEEKQIAAVQLNGQVTALQLEIASLKQNKDEMLKKTMSLESTIESLNSQLVELGSSETLARAKQQHEAIVAAIRQKCDAESLAANQRIDDLTKKLSEKDEQLVILSRQSTELEKINKSLMQDHAEEINRLHRSLKQSQSECRELLETQGNQELTRLKLRLQDAIAGKSLVDDLNSTLQLEVQELREQVRMYEMVTMCTTTHTSTTPSGSRNFDDSYAQLGIKKTNQISRNSASTKSSDSGVVTTDDALHGLKTELERCLKKCREKSELITKLQSELKTCKSSLAENITLLEAAQKELSDMKLNKDGQNRCESLEKEISAVCKEKEALKLELEDVRCRLIEAAESEARVTELNVELNQHIAQLMDRASELHDEDVDNGHEKRQQLESECLRLKEENFQLREQMSPIQMELMAAKELYINVCRAKDQLADELQHLQLEKQQLQIKAGESKEKCDTQPDNVVKLKELENELAVIKETHKMQLEALNADHEERLKKMTEAYDCKLRTITEKHELELTRLREEHENNDRVLNEERERQLRALNEEHRNKLTAVETQFEEKVAAAARDVESANEKLKKCQQELADLEIRHGGQLSEAEARHEREITKLQNEHSKQVGDLTRQTVSLQDLHRKTADDLARVQQEMSATLGQLKNEKSLLENELQELRKLRDSLQEDRPGDGEARFKCLLAEKSRLEEDLRVTTETYSKVEQENLALRKQIKDASSKLSEANRRLQDSDRKCEEIVTRTQESLEREHAQVIGTLQEKLAERSRAPSIDVISQKKLENCVSGETMKSVVHELNEHYLTVVEKIKMTALAHVKQTNQSNAAMLAQRLAKDRQMTARSLRNYYLRCLGKLLDADFDHGYKTQFMKRMERLLDNLPEKDMASASQCTTPSLQSSVSSPRELSSNDSTPRNLPVRINPAKPRDVPQLQLPVDSASSNAGSSESTPRDLSAARTLAASFDFTTAQRLASMITTSSDINVGLSGSRMPVSARHLTSRSDGGSDAVRSALPSTLSTPREASTSVSGTSHNALKESHSRSGSRSSPAAVRTSKSLSERGRTPPPVSSPLHKSDRDWVTMRS